MDHRRILLSLETSHKRRDLQVMASLHGLACLLTGVGTCLILTDVCENEIETKVISCLEARGQCSPWAARNWLII